MDSNNLFQGLNMFVSGVKQLQQSRTLQSANEVVNQVQNSENDDYTKMTQLRQVGQNLAFTLASQGAGPDEINNLTNQLKPYIPQNAMEAYSVGGPAKQAAQDLNKDTLDKQLAVQDKISQRALTVEQVKAKAMVDAANARASNAGDRANDKQDAQDLSKFQGAVGNLGSKRFASGSTLDIQNRLGRVDAAINSYQPGDPVPAVVAGEIGTGIAAAVKGSPLTLEEVDRYIPKTIATDAGKAEAYVQNNPQLLQIPDFMKIWKGQLMREHEQTQNQYENEVSKVANTYSNVYDKSPDTFKTALASQVGAKPSDIYKDTNGMVTWSQRDLVNKGTDTIVSNFNQAKMALKSSDAKTVIAAKQFFTTYGLDPTDPVDAVKRQIGFNIRAGKYDNLSSK